MSPEERTRALVAATISAETICSFGTPKDWNSNSNVLA